MANTRLSPLTELMFHYAIFNGVVADYDNDSVGNERLENDRKRFLQGTDFTVHFYPDRLKQPSEIWGAGARTQRGSHRIDQIVAR